MKLVSALAALGASARAGHIMAIDSRCHTPGQVALTFDDGPSPHTPEVLKVLREAGVTATFHISVGMLSSEAQQEHVRKARDDGHLIGLRVDPKLTIKDLDSMSLVQLKEKLDAESRSIHAVLGFYPRFLRLPFGFRATNGGLDQRLRSLGYIPTLWSVDSRDYARLGHDQMLKVTYEDPFRADVAGGPHSSAIILHRDLFDIAEVVKDGIRHLKAKDMSFVNLGQCTGADFVYKTDVEGRGEFENIDGETPDEVRENGGRVNNIEGGSDTEVTGANGGGTFVTNFGTSPTDGSASGTGGTAGSTTETVQPPSNVGGTGSSNTSTVGESGHTGQTAKPGTTGNASGDFVTSGSGNDIIGGKFDTDGYIVEEDFPNVTGETDGSRVESEDDLSGSPETTGEEGDPFDEEAAREFDESYFEEPILPREVSASAAPSSLAMSVVAVLGAIFL